MTDTSNVKLTIAFNDPDLEAEEREEQAQLFMAELQQIDEVEVDRVLDPNPPEGNKVVGAILVGLLTVQVNKENAQKVMAFLGDRLGNKVIELEVEANGKKLKVSAHSREELEAAIVAAQKFAAA